MWGSWLRTTLPIAFIFGALAVLEYNYFPKQTERALRSSLDAKAQAVAKLSAGTLRAAVEFDDKQTANEYLAQAGADRELVYAALFDEHGQLFAAHNPNNVKLRAPQGAVSGNSLIRVPSALIVESPVGSGSNQAGVLILRYSLASINQQTSAIEAQALMIALGILGFGIAAALVTGFSVARAGASSRQKLAADAANRAKSAFLARMTHELRTPLNGVLGTASLLERSPRLSRQDREFLGMIEQSGNSLLGLINNLLDLSKAEAGKLQLVSVPFDLRDLVESTARAVAPLAQRKNLDLMVDLETNDLIPRGDPTRIRQVLINLLSNAIKFTTEGQVILKVRLEETEQKRLHLELEVHDTGPGLTADQQREIMKPFVQASSQVPGQHGGTGLGLTICQELAELMGGEMKCESQLGIGSVFAFSAELEAESSAGVITVTPHPSLNGRHALIVDDSAECLKITRALLEKLGLSAAAAQDREALDHAIEDEQLFDVILIDLRMPDQDGLELARELKSSKQFENVPVIMLTCNPELEVEEPRVASWLAKPLFSATMEEAICIALDLPVDTPGLSIPPGPSSKGLGKLKVLVADDNPVNQKVVAAMLEHIGCLSEVVGSGREAVEALRGEHTFGAVIMDINMPDLDGISATEQIRKIEADEGREELPIFGLTAEGLNFSGERAREAGISLCLPKPIDISDLEVILAQFAPMIRRKPDAGSLPPRASSPPTDGPVDALALASLRRILSESDPSAWTDMVTTYATSAKDGLDKIEAALRTGDWTAIQAAAHSLKGASLTFSAVQLAETCAEIEKHAKGKARDQVTAVAKRAREQLRHALDALERTT